MPDTLPQKRQYQKSGDRRWEIPRRQAADTDIAAPACDHLGDGNDDIHPNSCHRPEDRVETQWGEKHDAAKKACVTGQDRPERVADGATQRVEPLQRLLGGGAASASFAGAGRLGGR